VIRRAAGGCEFCRFPAAYTNAPFHCEHVRPRDAGGETVFSNLAWVCPWCNAHKYSKTDGRDPQTGRRVALFNPRRQRWARHFAWSDNLLLIVGRTAIGRATVQELNLNRQEVVRLRRLLLAAGEHPPASG
jgi:hypothetical protein